MIFAAKEKLRNQRVHKTGGGPKPPDLNKIETAIATVFAKTPAFEGIVPMKESDSKIVLKRGPNNNDQLARACGAEMVAETSNLHKAVNSGKWSFC